LSWGIKTSSRFINAGDLEQHAEKIGREICFQARPATAGLTESTASGNWLLANLANISQLDADDVNRRTRARFGDSLSSDTLSSAA
jgi:hypothetical protein